MLFTNFSIEEFFILLIGAILFFFFVYAMVISLIEKEYMAAQKFCVTGFLVPTPLIFISLLDFTYKETILWVILGIFLLVILLFFLPIRLYHSKKYNHRKGRIDERDTMFSRNKLKSGTLQFDEYYKRNPDKAPLDEVFRKEPGLLSPLAINYHPQLFASADASFFVVEALKSIVDGPVAGKKIKTEAREISNYLKNWAKKLGALDIGITPLQDYHLYSYGGRDERYNQKIDCGHKFAIAFTVEMDKATTSCGPYAPIVMESAQQYLSSGAIATQLAAFIRNLGYNARAHIDGNYLVVCPLVAKDAGLGEIGRMGLLMTPHQGPRVRINVVTTDLPLCQDKPTHDLSVLDFCQRCKKCADTCPANAIPQAGMLEIDGVKRWQISQEACFTYWCKSGTDCGRCIGVCPYAHADNLLHNLIRFGIKNNYFFRRLALWLDDFFYGRYPAPKSFPKWLRMKHN